ncbi:Metallo-peptidase family M12B Reprolysin-like [Spirosomataceae bacterium TFI 002]|nr:Metallo-peptidase family M12B Reprolysin-like [Spirosomataceae bacterium TFI 002]
MKTIITITLLLAAFVGQAQQVNLAPLKLEINLTTVKQSLSNTAVFYSEDESSPEVSIGNVIGFYGIDGIAKDFRMIETPVFSKEYSKEHPEFKSYTGTSLDGKTQLKLSITPAGITGVLIEDGKYYYIEKSRTGTLSTYDLFNESQIEGEATCGFNEPLNDIDGKNLREIKGVTDTHGAQLRTYRIAIACTGEFTVQNGGTKAGANARINELLTLINARYETELATTFVLATGNDNIIFTDPTSDFFTPGGGADPNQSQNVFTNSLNTAAFMPYANYDIGQTLHYKDEPSFPAGAAGASGAAGPTPCQDDSKARSWTQYSEGTPGIANAAFLTGIIIHEMGHQFSAWHTFNGSGANCAPGTGQYDETAGYEPGSGNTIMSYNGICGTEYNLTGGKVNYFHARSLFQISSALNGSSGNCITPTANANAIPTANAGIDRTIPKGTPFVLTGTGTDANGNGTLTFTWDQYDQPVSDDQGALGTINGIGGYNAINSTTAPLFRTKQATNGTRVFPDLSFVLNNSNVPANNEGEALSAVAREIDMRLVVRDNKVLGGAFATDDVKITVANSGPFQITSQNTSTLWFQGTSQNIAWAVNNTNLAPVSCANVKISISYNGGTTFSTIVASTPNDGSYVYTVPNNPSTQVRIKIEAVGNIFFDINDVDFTISNQTCTPITSSISNASSVSGIEGSSALNLNLTPPSPSASYSYTFMAVNTANDQIRLFNGSADLRSLSPGSFRVYGLSFANGTDFGAYLNTTFTSFQTAISNGSICGKVSSNSKTVTITACPSIPNAPTSNNVNIFDNESAMLSASGCSGTYNWFETANSSSVLSTGPNYQTPVLTQSRSYFVSCLETCESQRAEVIVSVLSYCEPSPNCGFGDIITKVALKRNMSDFFSNPSGCISGGFKFYNSTVIDITQGETIEVEVTKAIEYPAGLAVWIDFNNDRDFQDPGELIFSKKSNSTPIQFGSFQVPANTSLGETRMRVKIDYSFDTSDPCLVQNSDGEVEDYLINILSSTNCANVVSLVSPTNDITSGTSIIRSNNNASGSNEGRITATNKITGGNTTYSAGKKVQLNPGFQASGTVVFKAEIGGCSN